MTLRRCESQTRGHNTKHKRWYNGFKLMALRNVFTDVKVIGLDLPIEPILSSRDNIDEMKIGSIDLIPGVVQ